MIYFEEWSYNCKLFGLSGVLCYAFAKFMLYQYYLARLYNIFSSSAFKFNTKILILSSIILITYNVVTSVLLVLTYHVIPEKRQIVYICSIRLPPYVFGIGNSLDQVISIVCLYLFTKPIVYLVNSINNSMNKDLNDIKLFRILVKVYTLSTVQFITTLIAGTMLAIGFGVQFWTTDAVINSICIALMNKVYTKTYNKLCCCMNKICGKCVIAWCVKMKSKPPLPLENVGTNSTMNKSQNCGRTSIMNAGDDSSTPKHIIPNIPNIPNTSMVDNVGQSTEL